MNQHHLVLFAFDFLSITLTNQFDPQHHVLLEQPTPGTYKVVKNGRKVKQLFDGLEKFKLRLVCYSSKNYKQTSPILAKMNQNLSWMYINVDKIKYPNVRPNCACLSYLSDQISLIQYGQGFSNSDQKEQIRIAICSALMIGIEDSRSSFILIQNNTQQIGKLKQNQYLNIFSDILEPSNLSHFFLELENVVKNNVLIVNKQFEEFISNCNSLNMRYARQISQFHYLENKKNVAPPLSLGIGKQPPNIYRLPNSMSICSIVFRSSGDKSIYVSRAELPSKIGGDLQYEIQQNKILQNCLNQTLLHLEANSSLKVSNYLCLPMYLSQFFMRNSLIKAYNKNKAYFISTPFLKDLKTISQVLKSEKQMLGLLKSGYVNGIKVKGLGSLLAFSLVSGQNFQQQFFFSTLAFVEITHGEKTISYQCCRIRIQKNFEELKYKNFDEVQIVYSRYPFAKIKVVEMHQSFIEEFKKTVQLIHQCLPILLGIFKSQAWKFSKSQPVLKFLNNLKILISFGEGIQTQQDYRFKKMKIDHISGRLLKYLVGSQPEQKFSYFTEQSSQSSQFGFDIDNENIYTKRMKESQNFVIFGQCVPVISLIKWIKIFCDSEVIYISLLIDRPETYIKHVKLLKSERKTAIFVIDHCEIEQAGGELQQGKSITDSNWGMRTIFIYRLKHSSQKRLSYMTDNLTSGENKYSVVNSKLPYSNQQTFKTIFELISKKQVSQNQFQVYKSAIDLYLKTKLYGFGKKIGISDIEVLHKKLRMLVSFISTKNNRIISIIKDKAFNELQQQLTTQTTLGSDHNSLQPQESEVSLGNRSQIQEHIKNVPNSQLILYCLPIFISNQRVWLIHDLHQYLNAFYLYQDIVDEKWNGRFEGEQAKCFLTWYPKISNKCRISKKLVKMIDRFVAEEKNNINKVQIMGQDNGINDCLQLLKKIGVQSIFCKLDHMFYLDSNVAQMIKLGNNGYLVLTDTAQILKIVKIGEEKEDWKMSKLEFKEIINKQQLAKNYVNIGVFYECKNSEDQIFCTFVKCKQKSKRINKLQNRIQMIVLDCKKQRSWMKKQLNISQIPELLQSQIFALKLIQTNIYIFVTDNGKLVLTKQNNEQMLCKNTTIDSLSSVHQLICDDQQMQLKLNVTVNLKKSGKKSSIFQNEENSDNKIKINYHVKNNGDIDVVVAVSNVHVASQNGDCPHFWGCQGENIFITRFVVNFQEATEKIKVDRVSEVLLLTKTQIKQFNVAFCQIQKQQDYFVEVIVFQSITNSLSMWKLSETNDSNCIQVKRDTPHRFYRIQNDPVGAYHFDNCIYVGSKYNLLKKMSLPKSQNKQFDTHQ